MQPGSYDVTSFLEHVLTCSARPCFGSDKSYGSRLFPASAYRQFSFYCFCGSPHLYTVVTASSALDIGLLSSRCTSTLRLKAAGEQHC